MKHSSSKKSVNANYTHLRICMMLYTLTKLLPISPNNRELFYDLYLKSPEVVREYTMRVAEKSDNVVISDVDVKES